MSFAANVSSSNVMGFEKHESQNVISFVMRQTGLNPSHVLYRTTPLTVMSCTYILTRLTLSDSGSSSMHVMLLKSVSVVRMLSLRLTTWLTP